MTAPRPVSRERKNTSEMSAKFGIVVLASAVRMQSFFDPRTPVADQAMGGWVVSSSCRTGACLAGGGGGDSPSSPHDRRGRLAKTARI